jgi:uncharacterized damage-inducible protein DinB
MNSTLMPLFSGWDGYNLSLMHAVEPLTPTQLAYRHHPQWRSVGELAAHIAFGRVDWFNRMDAPGSQILSDEIARLSSQEPEKAIANDAALIVHWLERSWQMVENNLQNWTIADLSHWYPQPYQGKTYAVSRQWTIWRIMAHDIHHGGQLTILLSEQEIEPFELTALGGHITEPPLAPTSEE